MTKAPEQIWIQSDHIPDSIALDRWDVRPDADEAHLFTGYIRKDVSDALVAAAYLDAANLHQSLWRETSAYKTDQILKRTPAGASAAIDRIRQEARDEGLREALLQKDKTKRPRASVSPDHSWEDKTNG